MYKLLYKAWVVNIVYKTTGYLWLSTWDKMQFNRCPNHLICANKSGVNCHLGHYTNKY